MRHVVRGFEHRQGIHCGSTAMADALRHAGLSISEEFALGLGSGPAFLLFERVGGTPSHFFLGRSVSFEADLCRLLGAGFEEKSVAGFDVAWGEIRRLLLADRPVLALSDLRFLPYYATTSHFNGHRIVVAGFDDERGVALLADSHFPGLQEVSIGALQEALESDHPPLTTRDCVFGVLDAPSVWVDVRTLVGPAVRLAAEEQLAPGGFTGVAGIERFATRLERWRDVPDRDRCLRFCGQVIEKRGCGGGLFRRMYARFLAEAAEITGERKWLEISALSVASAEAWTALAGELRSASDRADGALATASALLSEVGVRERRLWEAARYVAD